MSAVMSLRLNIDTERKTKEAGSVFISLNSYIFLDEMHSVVGMCLDIWTPI